MHVRILADDLTGAADAAIGFLSPAVRPVVRLGAPQRESGIVEPVVACDLDCREASATAAREVLDRAIAEAIGLCGNGEGLLFLKIDSTLRGHVELGIELLRERRAGEPLIVLPAFPEVGRIYAGGRLRVAGQAAETAGDLGGRLKAAGIDHTVVPVAVLRRGPAAAEAAMAAAIETAPVLLVDAEVRGDIDVAVEAAFRVSPSPRFVGSGGLSPSLSRQLFGATGGPESRPPAAPDGPCLWVVGSATAVAHRQIDALSARRDVRAVVVTGDSGGTAADAVVTALRDGHDAVLHLPAPAAGTRLDEGLLADLAEIAREAAREAGWLFLSGGATARAVLDALGVIQLELGGALLPGVARGVAAVGGRRLPIVLKAGAFHGADALVAIRGHMAGQTHREQESVRS